MRTLGNTSSHPNPPLRALGVKDSELKIDVCHCSPTQSNFYSDLRGNFQQIAYLRHVIVWMDFIFRAE